jgi:Ca-activated chloride channel family protein
MKIRKVGYHIKTKSVSVRSGDTTQIQVAVDTAGAAPSLRTDEAAMDPPVEKQAVSPQSGVPARQGARQLNAAAKPAPQRGQNFNTEDYATIESSDFRAVSDHPLSTFSIDVDGASYTNARRFIRDGETPPKDAVRIEEFLNYFQYDYPAPTAEDEHPFSVMIEGGAAPWRENHELVHVGLQGRRVPVEERPPSNLVFLIDVSGSMRSPQKLPLLKRGFRMLADQLRPEDRVAIVVYAGASGVVLESTPGDETDAIKGAIEQLRAGGSTAGAEGIRNAYSVAEEHFIEDGINRVILATDGDFNVGVSSDAQLQRLVEEKRDGGTALTVLGFGTGNLKDNKMETLANHGNGNYYYVDSASESRRVLVEELGSTLQTIAKDVKVQVEFNPAEVRAYRLIGYVNRELEDEEFADDSTDAGELGAGHSVTALYEVIRRGVESDVEVPTAGELKYQDKPEPNEEAASDELLTVNLRYKQPDGDTSQLLKRPLSKDVLKQEVSGDFHFAAAVAGLGMLLRDSEYKGDLALDDVRGLAEEGRGDDPRGTRAGFISLLEDARGLLPAESSEGPASNQ